MKIDREQALRENWDLIKRITKPFQEKPQGLSPGSRSLVHALGALYRISKTLNAFSKRTVKTCEAIVKVTSKL